MGTSVSAVDPAIASVVQQIAKYFHTEIVIAEDLKNDLPQWKITKDIIAGLSEAQTGFNLAADAEQTVALFEESLELLKAGVDGSSGKDVEKGLEKLGVDGSSGKD